MPNLRDSLVQGNAMTDTILFSRTGHIARLTLNNPERHNSLGMEEFRALQSYISEINNDEQLRVLILTGNGPKTF